MQVKNGMPNFGSEGMKGKGKFEFPNVFHILLAVCLGCLVSSFSMAVLGYVLYLAFVLGVPTLIVVNQHREEMQRIRKLVKGLEEPLAYSSIT
jgi:hypothetical protein